MRSVETRVTDIAQRVLKLKWKWAGHVARRTDERWGPKALEWPPRTVIVGGRPGLVGPQRGVQTTSNESLEAAQDRWFLEIPTKDLCP
ncbi:jg22444 [Pararge aegeria aegeria]|uniref:Jg22444 protein n=1 Tax=Pararge aegeria aegeria TaxID=348720 RepID=A0A8S4QZN5_9NEOP|nr:jg22444 [Pararge aegeria aegeria]